jgi:predicted ATPase/DNA-binding SARP family transcriptional activator
MNASTELPSNGPAAPPAHAFDGVHGTAPAGGMFRVLGSTEVQAGGCQVNLGGPLARRLLTALIAARGASVPDDRLAELVWGQDRPLPLQATAALRAYTSRLRRALGEQGRTVLRRQGSGYALRLAPDATDVARFTRQVKLRRELAVADRAVEAVQTLTEALSLWRGEPYADLGDAAEIEAARCELTGLRDSAAEERLAARLATGDNAGAVVELEAAVRQSPYRERLWELLVLGLYRAGRQGEALSALRRVRTQLAEELGIDPGPGLRELERMVLDQDTALLVPVVGTTGDGPTGLGWPLSSFFGRGRDMDSVAAAVQQHRLVTLVGPAGVGKTRLVIEHLATRSDSDGPWLARLADVAQPGVLAHAVAGAVGAADLGDEPQPTLVRALAGRTGLLILDNCEHLVAPVADLTQRLLEHCRGVRILATSREALGLDGEILLPVQPLPTHTHDEAEAPAVTLLLDRIRAKLPDWTPSPTEHAYAEQVCAALDGLPLAIELAAARTRVLSLREIADRLDDRFSLLGPVPRGSLTPHATLRAAIAWSIDQLAASDRALLGRLWPFEGGFTLEAAEAVRTTDAPTIDSLSTLVTRSVLIADTTAVPTRYRMLRTLRAYCRDHDSDPATTRKVHAGWVRDLVDRRVAEFTTGRAGDAMRNLTHEMSNLRAAIAHDLKHDPAAALRTAGRLNWFWHRGGHGGEALRLLDAALRAAPDAAPLDRGYARLAQIALRPIPEDPDEVRRGYDDVLAASSASDDYPHRALHGLTLFHLATNLIRVEAADAGDVSRRTIAVGKQLERDWLIAGALGAALLQQGRTAEGRETLAAAIDRATRCGYAWAAGCARLFLGWDILRDHPSVTDPRSRGEQALIQLRQAFAAFQTDADQILALAVLNTAAPALGLLGKSSDALALQVGAHRQAETLGVPARFFQRIGALIGDQVPVRLPDTAAPIDPPQPSWAAMVELLNTPPHVEPPRAVG